MVVPVIFFQASAVEGKTAIPPPIAIFKLLWSSCLNSSLFTKALNNVFTAGKKEGWYLRNSLITAGKSRGFGIRIFACPLYMPYIAQTMNAKI